METAIYLLLDCFDSLAIFCLMFSIFQYPIKEYFKEIAITCILIAITSYIIRIILDLSYIDFFVHITLAITCMRLLIKVKVWRCAFIVAVGTVGSIVIQPIFAGILILSDLITTKSISDSNGAAAHLIQVGTELTTLVLSYIINHYGLGSHKFVRPPHDFFIKEPLSRKKIISVLSSTITFIILLFVVYLLEQQKIVMVAGVLLIVVTSLIYITYRKEARNEFNNQHLQEDFTEHKGF